MCYSTHTATQTLILISHKLAYSRQQPDAAAGNPYDTYADSSPNGTDDNIAQWGLRPKNIAKIFYFGLIVRITAIFIVYATKATKLSQII